MNQTEVAKCLDWSLSKVQRIESGDVTVSVTDLRALLRVYRVDDAAEIERLVEDAQVSRRQRWYEAPEYRRHLSKGVRQLLQFEAEATAIRVYQPALVPGVLQTQAYAECVLNWWDKSLSDEDRRVRFDVRMLRRRQVLDRPDRPAYYLILDESVLLRKVGGAKVMAEQLETLEEISRLQGEHVHVRVLPLDKGAHAGILGPFHLLNLGEQDGDGDAVLYREFYNRDSVSHDAEELDFHRLIFEKLWAQSRTEEATRRAIVAEAAMLRRSLDE